MFCNTRFLPFGLLMVVVLWSTASAAEQSPNKDSEARSELTIENMSVDELRSLLVAHQAVAGTGHENRGLIRKLRLELAKRGDKEKRRDIFMDLHSKDLAVQSMALEDVADLGDREAIQHLAKMLDDVNPGGRYRTVGPDGEEIVSSQAFLPPRIVAAKKLAELVDFPPVPPLGPQKKFYTEEDVSQWRKWWQSNVEAERVEGRRDLSVPRTGVESPRLAGTAESVSGSSPKLPGRIMETPAAKLTSREPSLSATAQQGTQMSSSTGGDAWTYFLIGLAAGLALAAAGAWLLFRWLKAD